MSESTRIADKLKQTIDEMDVDRHLNDFVVQVEGLFATARDQVAILAAERGGDVERLLDKVSTAIDEHTQGRFAPHVDRVRETVSSGVLRLAEHRPPDTTASDTTASDTAASDTAAPADGFEVPPAGDHQE